MCYELDKRLNDGSFAKRQSFAGSLCDCTNHLPYNFYYGNYSYTFFVADHSLLQKMDEVKDEKYYKNRIFKIKAIFRNKSRNYYGNTFSVTVTVLFHSQRWTDMDV